MSNNRRHPRIKVMVNTAIKKLNEVNGSSVKTICNFISNYFEVDGNNNFIKRYIIKSVARNELQQITGRGACGRFKIVEKKNTQTKIIYNKYQQYHKCKKMKKIKKK